MPYKMQLCVQCHKVKIIVMQSAFLFCHHTKQHSCSTVLLTYIFVPMFSKLEFKQTIQKIKFLLITSSKVKFNILCSTQYYLLWLVLNRTTTTTCVCVLFWHCQPKRKLAPWITLKMHLATAFPHQSVGFFLTWTV